MTGVIWMVQLCHYPLLKKIPAKVFEAYQTKNMQLTTWVVIPAMLLELISQSALVYLALTTELATKSLHLLSAGCLISVWASTFLLQVPLHQKLSQRKSLDDINALVQSNWIRTFFWTLKSALLIVLVLYLN